MIAAPAARRLRSERGSILLHTALALVSFTAVSALVIDLGQQLVARHQIQTSADAAALAGATALSYDSYTDRSDGGPAKRAALAVATSNTVWGQSPVVAADDVTFPACPDSFEAGPSAPPKLACVKVAVYRNAEHSNPLATMFGQLFGVATAGVAAAATAESKEGNATDCLKPLAVPDRWVERNPVSGAWTAASTFDKWDPANPSALLSPPDSYTAPTALSTGSGLTMNNAFGTTVVLGPGTVATPTSPIAPWQYLPVQIPDSRFGTDVRQNIEQCAASLVAIGDRLSLGAGGVSAVVASALQTLVNRDPAARWDPASQTITGSCADARPRCASLSPRVIALAVYDPGDLADRSRTGATSVLVRNIVGFFIDSVSGTAATGHITRHPGRIQTTATRLIDGSSFLRASLLVE